MYPKTRGKTCPRQKMNIARRKIGGRGKNSFGCVLGCSQSSWQIFWNTPRPQLRKLYESWSLTFLLTWLFSFFFFSKELLSSPGFGKNFSVAEWKTCYALGEMCEYVEKYMVWSLRTVCFCPYSTSTYGLLLSLPSYIPRSRYFVQVRHSARENLKI